MFSCPLQQSQVGALGTLGSKVFVQLHSPPAHVRLLHQRSVKRVQLPVDELAHVAVQPMNPQIEPCRDNATSKLTLRSYRSGFWLLGQIETHLNRAASLTHLSCCAVCNQDILGMATPQANVNGEVAKLFARLTVDQVTEREAQLRVDIERKQQQLRHLVSDRYRDLVGSVDVLKRMQQESRRVVGHIERARGVRGREDPRGGDGGASEWGLACAARQLLQVEAAAWHAAGRREWREAGQCVREGRARLEEWRPMLAARVPVVLAGPLGDDRLLLQIVQEAKKRLAAPQVLSEAEKESLCACVGEPSCLLEGRIAALEAALQRAGSEGPAALGLCCALVEESQSLPGFLTQAAALAESRMPPVRDLAGTVAQLGKVAEGPWEEVGEKRDFFFFFLSHVGIR